MISINVGQSGNRIGSRCFELYCLEHAIGKDGILDTNIQGTNGNSNDLVFRNFFTESQNIKNKFIPRALFMDTEPETINTIKKYDDYRSMYRESNFLMCKEGASDIFSRGKYTVGRELQDPMQEKIRSMVEECDNFGGFLLYRSICGGTGSGLGSGVLQHLGEEYTKKVKLDFNLFPSPNQSNNVVSPYNAAMALMDMIEYADFNMIFDNEALYDMLKKSLAMDKTSYQEINSLMAHANSHLTSSLRFPENYGESQIYLTELMQTGIVPYPKLHFLLPSYAPLVKKNAFQSSIPVPNLIKSIFTPDSLMAKVDNSKCKYMSSYMFFRGEIIASEIIKPLNEVKSKKLVEFVDWSPSGFRVGINHSPSLTYGDLSKTPKSLLMLSNNTSITKIFKKIEDNFSSLYRTRAFAHWFVGEGLESSELQECFEQLKQLADDYQSIHTSS
ncbi:Tubulin alpha-1B chain [Tieghemostelium lacteum]|uniref:Tubulin alpha-1B chain n=1 Tax=Tieghemostelium lacteum TaxID=361077 RepID=A0A151Z4J7_TIELA|nr:Tubulin alpha-1B chain [Tieghemostelium lacteum]|eukprot:KYQ88889.1 Tubulin alpha-1B chain [Tieghemostelium lacteum]